MSDQPEPLIGQRHERESSRAVLACNDYLRMGIDRSLAKLQRNYSESAVDKPPTKTLRTLFDWSRFYDWQARAAAYDAEIERQKNEATEARRREVLETGLALDFERVLRLKELTKYLFDELYQTDGKGNVTGFKPDSVWLPDVKQIGGGEFAERVDLVRFDTPLFDTLRGLLDDLAKETGGRKQKVEHTGEVSHTVKTIKGVDTTQI